MTYSGLLIDKNKATTITTIIKTAISRVLIMDIYRISSTRGYTYKLAAAGCKSFLVQHCITMASSITFRRFVVSI